MVLFIIISCRLCLFIEFHFSEAVVFILETNLYNHCFILWLEILVGWKCPWFWDRLLNALVCPLGVLCIDLLPQDYGKGENPLLFQTWVRELSRALPF